MKSMLVAGKERCIRCMHLLDEEGHCAKCEFDASSYKQPNMALPLGTCLNERYFLGKVLGEGGFGITYVAWDIVLMVPVAVKEYFPSGIATREKEGPQTGTLQIYEGKSELEFEKGKEDFLKEARSLSRFMKLPSIVSVRDFFQENRTAYIVMEYVEGTRVRNYIRKNGKMSGEQVLALMEPVIHSLCDIHKTGLIHRDISIDNLMFDENGQLKLIDFGAARNVELPENTITVSIKRGFSPEEQYRAKGEQGPWTDLYSLCGTMYFMLTGKVPDESVERVYADHLVPLRQWEDVKLPMQAKCAIDKGMAVLAKDRWQDMEEFYNELYPDNKRISSYDEVQLPKSFRDTLTRSGVAGLFSKTAIQREFGENMGQTEAKHKKGKWMIAGLILVVMTVGGILLYQNHNSSADEEKSIPVNVAEKTVETAVPTANAVSTPEPTPEEMAFVEIPKVMGKTAGKAKKKLQKLGVRVKIEKAYNKKKKGTVVQQSIAAGTQVKKESVIILTVSRGGKRAVQTAAPTKAPAVTARPKTTKRPQKYDASLDGYLQ